MNQLSIYGSHDSSVCLHDGENYRILELEKFTSKRYCCLSKRVNSDPKATEEEVFSFYKYIKDTFKIDTIETVLWCEFFPEDRSLFEKFFKVKEYVRFDHHLAHAACAFYQSPYEKALIVSFDGGGTDLEGNITYFNLYIADKYSIRLLKRINLNLGIPYEKLGTPIKEICKSTNTHSHAGKMMGLALYGKHDERLVYPVLKYYGSNKLKHLCVNGINQNIETESGIEGQESYNLAYMSQVTFQTLFEKAFRKIQREYSDYPVCFSGGGALNILNNQTWYKRLNGRLLIPPNPNDCGLTFGALVYHDKPKTSIDITYSGFDILDREKIIGTPVDSVFIAKKLSEGKIIGSIMGRSEIGPRALGNRSILCDPSIPGMKDTLNAKVKFREWFRPFAPIVRLEDVNTYFDFVGESRFMNFCPTIREEYHPLLPAILHVDNTGRVQTVTKSQHPYMYELLGEFQKLGKLPVLLNTSLNIRGHSIITKIEDALTILKTTELDGVLIEGKWYLEKKDI